MSKKFTTMLNKLIDARSGLLGIRTNEERRAEVLIANVARACAFKTIYVWRVSTGLVEYGNRRTIVEHWRDENPDNQFEDLAIICKSGLSLPSLQPDGVLEYLLKFQSGPALVIMEDLGLHIAENSPNRARAIRLLKDLGIKSQGAVANEWVQIVAVDRDKLDDIFISVKLPLPTKQEIKMIVEGMIESLGNPLKQQIVQDLAKDGAMDRILEALLGLEDRQVQQVIAMSLVETGKLNLRVLRSSRRALYS